MRFALVTWMVISPAMLHSQVCSPPPTLYRERVMLDERYAKEVGNHYTEHEGIAAKIDAQRNAIDRKYLGFMHQVTDGTTESIRRCCPQGLKDPIMIQMCNLGSYIQGGRKGVTSFLELVPKDKSSAYGLWVLSEIAFPREPEAEDGRTPFAPYGPVTTYIEELYRLVRSGNHVALRKFLRLLELANGEAAEGIEGDMEELLMHHPGIAAVDWRIMREYPEAIETVNEMMEDDAKHQAVKGILQECSVRHLDCDGLSSSFK